MKIVVLFNRSRHKIDNQPLAIIQQNDLNWKSCGLVNLKVLYFVPIFPVDFVRFHSVQNRLIAIINITQPKPQQSLYNQTMFGWRQLCPSTFNIDYIVGRWWHIEWGNDSTTKDIDIMIVHMPCHRYQYINPKIFVGFLILGTKAMEAHIHS